MKNGMKRIVIIIHALVVLYLLLFMYDVSVCVCVLCTAGFFQPSLLLK